MTVLKRGIRLLFLIALTFFVEQQRTYASDAPSIRVGALFCDLLRHTDYQSENGYLLQPQWSADAFQRGQAVHIENKKPLFSWILDSDKNNTQQVAYQVLVADRLEDLNNNIGNVWNSGKVREGNSTAVLFNGQPLTSNKMYYWKVKAWDNHGSESAYSYTACFFTGELKDAYTTVRYPLQRSDQYPSLLERRDDYYFADFGKAAFGQLRIKLKSDGRDTVIVRLGEKLSAPSKIDRDPGGTIRYQEYHLPLQEGTHTYQIKIKNDKRNTGPAAIKMPAYIGEVLPFRFIEIAGYRGELVKQDIVQSMVHYPFNDSAASFHSSNSILNQVWDLCKYSVKATTFAGVYVDGDRERIPYEADAYINQLCHYAMDSEFTLARYSHEYLIHHATWPTEWILQSVLMAWNDYSYTGDIRSVARYYDDLKAKTLTVLEESNGLISTRTGKQNEALLKSIHYDGKALKDIVDWPQSGILGLGKEEAGETDGFVFKDYNVVVNAYYYRALQAMAKLAADLGRNEDVHYYHKKADAVYEAFQQHFFDKERHIYVDGVGTDHTSLHGNMFALAFDLVPKEYRSTVSDFIRSRGMACSVYGSQFLMDALYNGEDGDYALSLLISESERSWYNMIRSGSTITMEAWDDKYKPNQDWNHIWGGVPANIIPRKLMGIEPLTPGWSSFRVKPQLGNLTEASINIPTIKGDIKAKYEQKAQYFSARINIPVNTTAVVYLPINNPRQTYRSFINGEEKKGLQEGAWIKFPSLGSGDYFIEINYK